MSNLTQDNLSDFKKEYSKAVEEKREVFLFEDTEVLTAYAKYAIEYMELEPPEKTVSLHVLQNEGET